MSEIYTPSDGTYDAIIVVIHGGCFDDRNANCDIIQNKALAQELHVRVIQPEFSTISLSCSLRDLCTFINNEVHITQNATEQRPIYLLGRSSGCLIAKHLYEKSTGIDGAIYIAPVMDPYARMLYIPSMREKQICYFRIEGYMKQCAKLTYKFNEIYFCTKTDDRVPLTNLSNEQRKHVIFINAATHDDLCRVKSAYFFDTLRKQFLFF